MASRGRVRSAELSSSDKTATKKAKGVNTASVSDPPLSPENQSELIKELSKGVLDTIRASIQEVIRETIDRELSKAVDKLTKVFEERLSKLESTCRQLEEKVQEPRPTAGESDLQQQVLCLQHALHQEEHAANFVLSGVPEATNQGEENHSKTVIDVCKKELGWKFLKATSSRSVVLVVFLPPTRQLHAHKTARDPYSSRRSAKVRKWKSSAVLVKPPKRPGISFSTKTLHARSKSEESHWCQFTKSFVLGRWSAGLNAAVWSLAIVCISALRRPHSSWTSIHTAQHRRTQPCHHTTHAPLRRLAETWKRPSLKWRRPMTRRESPRGGLSLSVNWIVEVFCRSFLTWNVWCCQSGIVMWCAFVKLG